MKIAAVVSVYNEEKNIAKLIDIILKQTRLPEEIIIVDDGSFDKTAVIAKSYVKNNPIIKYLYQDNRGPAAGRNRGWNESSADICAFTDGDCLPEENWIEEIIKPFSDPVIGATGGAYKTLNSQKLLARFIGLEIDWRYYNKKEIKAHGAYNLAVRKNILKEVGGFNEEYPKASGEDWDLTYKISKKHKIIFVPSAIVGHYHPEKFWSYMKNQARRAYDRVKIYKDHPEMKKGDNYTGGIIKYQIVASGLFIPSCALIYPFFRFSYIIPIAIFLFLILSAFISFPYLWKKDKLAAIYGVFVQLARNFAWLFGLVRGIVKYGIA